MGYPKGLIRYTTENVLKHKYQDTNILSHVLRPRVFVYIGILLTVVSVFLVTFAIRVPLRVEVIRDRATLSRTIEDGRMENLYTLQILNMESKPHHYTISAMGADNIEVVVDDKYLSAGAQETIRAPLRLRVDPANLKGPSTPIMFRVQSVEDPKLVRDKKSSFLRR